MAVKHWAKGGVQLAYREDGTLSVYAPSASIALGETYTAEMVAWLNYTTKPQPTEEELAAAYFNAVIAEGEPADEETVGPDPYEAEYDNDLSPEETAEILRRIENSEGQSTTPFAEVMAEYADETRFDVDVATAEGPRVLSAMSLNELRAEAKARGLSGQGGKDELRERIIDAAKEE